MIPSHELFVGAHVSWLHVPRGGYGYVVPVDAEVVAINLHGDRARIRVLRANGESVTRIVSHDRLVWRGKP